MGHIVSVKLGVNPSLELERIGIASLQPRYLALVIVVEMGDMTNALISPHKEMSKVIDSRKWERGTGNDLLI